MMSLVPSRGLGLRKVYDWAGLNLYIFSSRGKVGGGGGDSM